MIRVLVYSAADFTKDELAAKNIEMVPLTITVNDDKNYRDEYDLDRDDLYRIEDAGLHVDGMCELGATLGVHVGPGAFGYIYVEK